MGWTMGTTSRAFALAYVLAFCVSGLATHAQAGGFALREQSSFYQGTSFAGAAAGATLSSMFWNPAALGTVGEGFTNEAVFSFVVPTSDVTVTNTVASLGVTPGSRGDIGLDAFIPGSYGAYRVNERLALGFSVNGPFGLATKFPMGDPIRNVAGTSEVFSLNVAPTVAYEIADGFTVALGAQIQYLDVRYTNNLIALSGDDIAFGFTAGLLWEPMSRTTIGLGFRSSVGHTLEGSGVGGSISTTAGAVTPIRIDDFNTPEMVTFSVEQRISNAFRLSGTVEWANWSRAGTFPVINASTGNVLTITPAGGGATPVAVALEYGDSWYFALGGEYDYSDDLTLRAGIGYELSPVGDAVRSLRLPDDDRLWLSAGLSYTPRDHIRLDAGYTYIHVGETGIPSTFASNGGVSATADADVHIFTLGVNVALEDGLAGLFGH